MKLQKEQKIVLRGMKKYAREHGVKTIHVPYVVTICWERMFSGSKMVIVSTSFMDEDDNYNTKTGVFYALARILGGEQVMQLPLGEYSDAEIKEILTDMFTI